MTHAKQNFVDVSFSFDEQTLADEAVANLQVAWPSWEPNEGDLEVVMIETIAAMAADLAAVASAVPASVFRAYGTVLLGIDYEEGLPSAVSLGFVMVDNAGYVIPEGTEVDVDGFAFSTDVEVTIAPGDTVAAGVAASSSVIGVASNGLTGAVVSMISALAFVASVSSGASSGGVDQETDEVYQDRLAAALQLRSRSLVTPRDYVILALQQTGIGRATASTTEARVVTVAVTDHEGEVVSAGIKAALVALYDLLRLVNVVPVLVDPVYSDVDVAYVVHQYGGYDIVELHERIEDVIRDYLSPAGWGVPRTIGDIATQLWLNDPVVRKHKLIDLIGSVDGVDYVDSVTLVGFPNLVVNPSFEINTADWAQIEGTGSMSRLTTANLAHSGVGFLRQENPGTNGGEGAETSEVVTSDNTTYVATVWLRGVGLGGGEVVVKLNELTAASALVGSASETIVLSPDWQRVYVEREFGATGVRATVSVAGSASAVIEFDVDDASIVEDVSRPVLNADGDLEIPGYVALPRSGTITGDSV